MELEPLKLSICVLFYSDINNVTRKITVKKLHSS